MKKRLMILGASYSQIPLIAAAKRLGVTTLAASIPGNYRGFDEADEKIYVDITDPQAVLEKAREARIDGITTCCMDLGIKAIGLVCETLGLPGLSVKAADAATNKYHMKELFMKNGVNTARYFKVSSKEELENALDQLTFPVMVKAVDLMGSRGIFRSDSREEALANYEKSMEATNLSYCIVEEFLQGTMFGMEAMVSNGKLAYLLPLGNDLRDGNPPFPVGHHVPWKYAGELERQVREQAERVVAAMGLDNCPVDMDCMLMDGKVYIIEATGRAGATCITDTVGIYYGIDYYEAIVKVALGMDVTELFEGNHVPHMPSVTRLLSADRTGTVKDIVIPEQLPEGVIDLSFNIARGSQVQPMANGRDRIGQLIVKGDSLEKCYRIQKEILTQIHLEMEPGSEGETLC